MKTVDMENKLDIGNTKMEEKIDDNDNFVVIKQEYVYNETTMLEAEQLDDTLMAKVECDELEVHIKYENMPYECSVCFVQVQDVDAFFEHMKTHLEPEGEYASVACQSQWEYPPALRTDTRTPHTFSSSRGSSLRTGHSRPSQKRSEDGSSADSAHTADSMMEESTNPEESSNAITIEVDVHHRHYSQLSASIATTSHDCVNEPETTSDLLAIHRDYPKTAAQRMAEYRARKKKETPIVNHQKHRKSDAERAKEYRARKKAKIQSADLIMEESTNPEESSNAITVQVDFHHRHYSQLSAPIATTSHDCVNELETTSDLPFIHRDYPKTAAQRMAEYRARKKKETPIVNHRKHKKSDAERAKEYRARKKAKIQEHIGVLWPYFD